MKNLMGRPIWTSEDMDTIRKAMPGCEVSFLNPAFRTDDLSDQHSVFGRDMMQVFLSDAVFVDARDRRGLGVGAEMMWAKFHRKPVVAWAPLGTHYHKKKTSILGVPVDDFIHPFVFGLCDKVAETLSEGAQWLVDVLSNPKASIKGVEHMSAAMQYYKDKQLPLDKPMKELLSSSEQLKSRVQNLTMPKIPTTIR